ncbi:MAG TPA: 4-hydroxyphenylacetate decarboxylase small subunit [Thermotogota bacterium]|nr:4-hydroxyphenylacetate decarboxylase small subunit [Thermotogota bacterium]HRW91518.1 4-hydroxyphenylacetate decarboxylase small subunit [Thermotogota bacterium]
MRQHQDCFYYSPIDVTHGVCRVSGDPVLGDKEACDQHRPLLRCRDCAHYSPDSQQEMGICRGFGGEYWTIPSFNATTCEKFAPGEE